MANAPLVLGIETSCDETRIGLVRGHTLLANPVASSIEEHARFGGVVPEVGSRAHLEAMTPTVEAALAQAGAKLSDVDAVAVTAGPGLAGALLVGVAAAKAYALGLGVPLYGVNHLAAPVAVDPLEHGPLPQPCTALPVSGGHSSLLPGPDAAQDVIFLRSPAGRTSTGRPATGPGRPSRSPAARSTTGRSTSPSRGSRPPSPAGWRRVRPPVRASTCPTWRPLSRRRSSTC